MHPIETAFDGRLFRSRLEARYAVFFKTLDIRYEYEPEGFDLDGVRYLPDFWIPDLKAWVEVKPVMPNEDSVEFEKCARLAYFQKQQDTATRVFIVGPIPTADQINVNDEDIGPVHLVDVHDPLPSAFNVEHFFMHENFAWTECPTCHRFDIILYGNARFLECCPDLQEEIRFFEDIANAGKSQWWLDRFFKFEVISDSPRLIAAYDAARMARFEHGRSGN